jgi:hypothetical protein
MLLQAACALLLGGIACNAFAASIYQCTNGQHATTFRDTPCAAHAQQRKITVTPQPLIGAPGEHAARMAATSRQHTTRRPRKRAAHARRVKPVMSWECRAADGEVFYRHTRCPSSVPGDGVVRDSYAASFNTGHSRRRHNAWSRVPVHGTKIPRAEACERIESAGASGRDGHLRDERVSTYDHLMGRDPCSAV